MADAPRNPDDTPERPEPRPEPGPDPGPEPGPEPGREPGPDPGPEPGPEPRRLTRSGSDAIIGAVAGGLGRYFAVDPILFRIGFVVLTFVGGVGVLAYLGLLAFVPSDDDDHAPGGKVGPIAGAVALGLALVIFLGPPLFFIGPGLLVVAVVVLAGVLLWRAFGGEPHERDPARTAARIAVVCLIGVATAGAAIGVGVAAALGGGVVIASLAVVAGLVLIGTAFVGGARWLIVPAVALILPLGIVAAAGIDLDGGVGERDYRPASLSELRDGYDIGIGSLDVDLSDVDLPPGRTELAIDVGVGRAIVYVPADTCVTSDIEVGAGGADLLDRRNSGLDVSLAEAASSTTGRPELHLDGDVGVGVIEVVREGDLPDYADGERWHWRERSSTAAFQGTGCA